LALLGLSTFLRVMVGTWASRVFLGFSGSRVWIHASGRLLVQWSCLLASRVSPYVDAENVGVVTMQACGTPYRWEDVMVVVCARRQGRWFGVCQ
jgi:hypothetical protein